MQKEDVPLVLTVPELCEKLKIGRNTAYNLLRSGEIRSIRVGAKKIRIPYSALEEYINNSSNYKEYTICDEQPRRIYVVRCRKEAV